MEHDDLYDDEYLYDDPIGEDYGDPATEGCVWVCMACGKRASDRTTGGIDIGWDVSCFLNAMLCKESSLRFDEFGRVEVCEPIEERDKIAREPLKVLEGDE